MQFRKSLQTCSKIALVVLTVSLASHAAPPNHGDASSSMKGVQITTGYETPDAAAAAMLRAIVTQDHNLFIQTRLLGVCEGKNEWPRRYAECLHSTKLTHGDVQSTVYDLTRRMMSESIRPASTQELKVPLGLNLSHYYSESYVTVDLEIANSDEVKYRTRIVVAKTSERWYAIPRRTRCPFYTIADTLPPVVHDETNDSKQDKAESTGQ